MDIARDGEGDHDAYQREQGEIAQNEADYSNRALATPTRQREMSQNDGNDRQWPFDIVKNRVEGFNERIQLAFIH